MEGCFRILDDFQMVDEKSKGVLLFPGGKYVVTVELDPSHASHGLHAHCIAFAFCDSGVAQQSDRSEYANASEVDTSLASANEPSRFTYASKLRRKGAKTYSNTTYPCFALLRRFVANVALSVDELQLSADAKPFVPVRLFSTSCRPLHVCTCFVCIDF